tara:strand:- start:1523 stop:2110 length:588 start_codon:yes stop_codon:yes gene_type:complete
MTITKQQLKQIIKEEVRSLIKEGVPGRWHDIPGMDIASPEVHASSRANRPRFIPDEPRWLATDLDPEEDVPLYGDKKKAAEWERLVERAKNRGIDLDQRKHLWYNSKWWDMYDEPQAKQAGERARAIYWGVDATNPTAEEVLASWALQYWASLEFPSIQLNRNLVEIIKGDKSLYGKLRIAAQGPAARPVWTGQE